jgi:hypothetical protein
MSQSILLVFSNCDAEREEEFNRWYDTVHVPDILAIEGFEAARRYKLAGPAIKIQPREGEPVVAQYLAVYEMAEADTSAAMKRLGEASAGLTQRGRMFDGLRVAGVTAYSALGDRQGASVAAG